VPFGCGMWPVATPDLCRDFTVQVLVRTYMVVMKTEFQQALWQLVMGYGYFANSCLECCPVRVSARMSLRICLPDLLDF